MQFIVGQTIFNLWKCQKYWNKANHRDLIAATGLIILPKSDTYLRFFGLYDLESWRITLANDREALPCHRNSEWIGATIRKSNSNRQFYIQCDFKFDRGDWKLIGHLLYATWNFVHRFIAIGEYRLELQSKNAQFGSKLKIWSRVTLKFTGRPKKQQGASAMLLQVLCVISQPLANLNWIHSPETFNSGQNWRFLSRVTYKIDALWPWKRIGDFLHANSNRLHHLATCESNRSYGPKMPKLEQIFLGPLWRWPLTSAIDLLHGHHFCQW